MYGTRSEVRVSDGNTGDGANTNVDVTNAYAVYARMENDNHANGQTTSGMTALYYGIYHTTNGLNSPYGIYIDSSAPNNYIGGNLEINGGLKDKDGDVGTSGQVLTSTGSKINWVDASSITDDTNTLYDLVTSTSGNNINLKLDASTGEGDDDDITITAGENITLTDNSNGGFTIDATDTNTTYTLPAGGTNGDNFTDAKGSATITLTGINPSSTDTVTITPGDNIKITDTGENGFTIHAQNTEGSNTVSYTHLTLPTIE